MKIFVDADSCPLPVRDVVSRAALRLKVVTVFAANHVVPIETCDLLKMVIVAKGEGVADQYIIDHVSAGDLVVTRDIPLAAELVGLGAVVINDRGDHFTPNNIRERLSIRDRMKEFRDIGIMPSADRTYGRREIQQFAAVFDREITKLLKQEQSKDN